MEIPHKIRKELYAILIGIVSVIAVLIGAVSVIIVLYAAEMEGVNIPNGVYTALVSLVGIAATISATAINHRRNQEAELKKTLYLDAADGVLNLLHYIVDFLDLRLSDDQHRAMTQNAVGQIGKAYLIGNRETVDKLSQVWKRFIQASTELTVSKLTFSLELYRLKDEDVMGENLIKAMKNFRQAREDFIQASPEEKDSILMLFSELLRVKGEDVTEENLKQAVKDFSQAREDFIQASPEGKVSILMSYSELLRVKYGDVTVALLSFDNHLKHCISHAQAFCQDNFELISSMREELGGETILENKLDELLKVLKAIGENFDNEMLKLFLVAFEAKSSHIS